MTPRERFLRDADRIRFLPPEDLDRKFLHEYSRKVRTDSTIQIDNVFYDVPFEYMREKVTVYIDPNQPEQAWILPKSGRDWIRVKPVNKHENRVTKRKQHMSFGKGEG